jgi:hypothetical protein
MEIDICLNVLTRIVNNSGLRRVIELSVRRTERLPARLVRAKKMALE